MIIYNTYFFDFFFLTRIYMCLQSTMKYHPLFDEAITGILKTDSSAIVVFLLNEANALWNLKLKSRLFKHFENHKIHISARVLYIPQMKSNVYQKVLCSADINLDPFPFGN